MTTRGRPLAVVCGAAALALYVLTLAPDVSWGDSAQLQIRAAFPEFGTGPRSYSLFVAGSHLLWRVSPLSPAVAANLFAALCGALGVGLACAVGIRESNSRIGGAVAAATLGLAHLYWSSSSVAEVYSLSAVFLLILLLLVRPAADGRRRAIFVAGAVVGLGLLHHRVIPLAAGLAALPLVGVWVRERTLLRGLAAGALGFLAGCVPLLVLVALEPAAGLRGLTTGAGFRLPGASELPGLAAYVALFFAWNLAGPQTAFALVGATRALRRITVTRLALFVLLALGLLLPFLFAGTGDRYIFLIPALVASAVFAGLGAARLAARPLWAYVALGAVVILPVAIYALASTSLRPGTFGRFRDVDERHLQTWLWPGKSGHTEPRAFADRVLVAVPPEALLLHHWGDGETLRYLKIVEGARSDLGMVRVGTRGEDEAVRAARSDGRAIYLTSYPWFPRPRDTVERYPGREVIAGELWDVTQP